MTAATGSGGHPYDALSHQERATLAREFLLGGHLIDRAGMPHLIAAYDREVMEAIAIDEWMGASPVYSRRMQRAMRFEGDSVETIFKGMQLDIGAPPEFLDFRFVVSDHDHGEFWLDHCGALMDVEPMGDDYVVTMCHHIEDPTFDATACASNPRARMTPVHRPPRRPADRHPHCRWNVDIVADAEPIVERDLTHAMAATLAAGVAVDARGVDDDGWSDYARPLDADLRMEDFSSRALSVLLDEAALQGHLLSMSFIAAVESRYGTEAAVAIGARQLLGTAGVVAGRLTAARGLRPDAAGFAELLDLHPAFHPRSYVDWTVSVDAGVVTAELGACPATSEAGRDSWMSILAGGDARALDAIVGALDPRARCRSTAPVRGGVAAWRVVVGDEAVPEPDEVVLTRFSTGAAFEFQRVGPRS